MTWEEKIQAIRAQNLQIDSFKQTENPFKNLQAKVVNSVNVQLMMSPFLFVFFLPPSELS